MARLIRSTVIVVVGALLLWGGTRAATGNYKERIQAAQLACVEDTKKLGKAPTPSVTLEKQVLLTPGESAAIKLTGKFPEGTQFVWDDGVTVETEKVLANSYTATIRLLSGAGPGPIHVTMFVRGHCHGQEINAAVNGGKFDFQIKADNGWRVSLKNSDSNSYCVEFYQGTETKPFETRGAIISLPDRIGGRIMFSLDQNPCGGDPAKQMEELMKKMYDPNLSEKQREAFMAKYQQMMLDMVDMDKLKAKEAKANQFGFNRITLEPDGTGFKGNLWFAGSGGKTANITGGSMKFVGK